MAGGLHEYLEGVRKSLDRVGDGVVQTTMFYPHDMISGDERRQQQQQQQQ